MALFHHWTKYREWVTSATSLCFFLILQAGLSTRSWSYLTVPKTIQGPNPVSLHVDGSEPQKWMERCLTRHLSIQLFHSSIKQTVTDSFPSLVLWLVAAQSNCVQRCFNMHPLVLPLEFIKSIARCHWSLSDSPEVTLVFCNWQFKYLDDREVDMWLVGFDSCKSVIPSWRRSERRPECLR